MIDRTLTRSYSRAWAVEIVFSHRGADDLNTGHGPRDFSKIAVDELTEKQAEANVKNGPRLRRLFYDRARWLEPRNSV